MGIDRRNIKHSKIKSHSSSAQDRVSWFHFYRCKDEQRKQRRKETKKETKKESFFKNEGELGLVAEDCKSAD